MQFPDPADYGKAWDDLRGVEAAFLPSGVPRYRAVYFSCDAWKVAVSLPSSGRHESMAGLSANSEFKRLPSGVEVHYRKVGAGGSQPSVVTYEWRYRGYALCFLVLNLDPTSTRRHFFEVTGTCFRLCHPSFVLDAAKALGLRFLDTKRVDFTLDLAAPSEIVVSELHDWFRANRKTTSLRSSVRNGAETCYLGDPASTNTYRLIRVYNKNADTEAKGKADLYPTAEWRTRVEVEYREDKAKQFDSAGILDTNYAWRLFSFDTRSFLKLWGTPKPSNLLRLADSTRDLVSSWNSDSPAAKFDRAMFGAFARNLFRRGATVQDLATLLPLAWEDYRAIGTPKAPPV